MIRIINGLLLIIGLTATALGFVTFRGSPLLSISEIVVGIFLLITSWRLDQKHVRQRAEIRQNAISARIAELTKTAWASHQSCKVPSNSFFTATISLLIGAACVVYFLIQPDFRSANLLLIIGCGLGFAFSVLALFRSLAGLGMPSIELNRYGFVTPVHGKISWGNVDGIHLSIFDFRGRKTYQLQFRLIDLQPIFKNAHWTERLLAFLRLGAFARGILTVQLPDGKEHPETISALASFLWKQATGKQHPWNPMFSTDYNDAMKRLVCVEARQGRKTPIVELVANPEKAPAEFEQIRNDLHIIQNERSRVSKQINWVIGVACAGVVVSVFWPILKRLW